MPLRSKVEKAVRKIVKGQIEANKTGCKSKKRHNWQLIGGHQEPHKPQFSAKKKFQLTLVSIPKVDRAEIQSYRT